MIRHPIIGRGTKKVPQTKTQIVSTIVEGVRSSLLRRSKRSLANIAPRLLADANPKN